MKIILSEWYRNKKYQQEFDEEVLNSQNLLEIRERAIQGIIQDGDYSGYEPTKYILRHSDGNIIDKFDEILSEIPSEILLTTNFSED